MPGRALRRHKQHTSGRKYAPMEPSPSETAPRPLPSRRRPYRPGRRRLPVPMERVLPPAINRSGRWCGGAGMRASLRRIVLAAAAVIAIGAIGALPGTAEARWYGGGWHGGWHGHGGWGGFGWGFAPGVALGFGAPYYGGYYGGPYYAYGGDCVMRRRWVINRWGHRVWRWTRLLLNVPLWQMAIGPASGAGGR